MLSATSPFADPNAPVLSKDGTIAYGTVAFDVPPDTLDDTYLTQLDNAVQPARAAGITVEYGGAAGKIASATDDRTSETDGRGGRPGGAGHGRLKFSAPACRIRAVRVDVSIEGQLSRNETARCVMCSHFPTCPSADRPDREAARIVALHPSQGWALLCNGVIAFDDAGEILPDGRAVAPPRREARPAMATAA